MEPGTFFRKRIPAFLILALLPAHGGAQNAAVTTYWPGGQVKSVGVQGKRSYQGTCSLFYPSGEKEGELTFDPKGTLLSAQGWYESGKPFFHLVPKEETPNGQGVQKARKGQDLSQEGCILYLSPEGRPLCASFPDNAEYGCQSLYWPNGNLALQCSISQGACREISLVLFDFQGKPFYRCYEGMIGSGNDSHCGSDDGFESNGLGEIQGVPNGPLTLGCWDIVQLLGSGKEKKIFTPILALDLQEGRPQGNLHLNLLDIDTLLPFKEGKLEGKFQTSSGTYRYKMGKQLESPDGSGDR